MIISLLAITISTYGMEIPPPKPTQGSDWQSSPADVRRIIQTMVLQSLAAQQGAEPDIIKQTVTNLNNFALVNKDFHDFLNSPNNIIELITSVSEKIVGKNELDIAQGLNNMPGMQNSKVQEWLAKRSIEIPREENLTDAVFNNDPRRTIRWLHNKANVNAQDKYSKFTPLTIAATKGYTDILQLLVAAGADINMQSGGEAEGTALQGATEAKKNEAVKILLKAGANPNIPSTTKGNTPLHVASEVNNSEAVPLLLNAQAKINAQNKKGYTALMWAAYKGNNDILTMLIDAHAHLDMQDSEGNTALIWAAYNNQKEAVQILLDADANPTLQSKVHGTALDMARKNANKEIEDLLLQKERLKNKMELK